MIANRPMRDIPELAALGTRSLRWHHDVTFTEIAALMKSLAMEGYIYGRDMALPADCVMVAEYIIDHMRKVNRPLDMRLYVNGMRDYLQWRRGEAKTHWEALLQTRINETCIVHEAPAEVAAREATVALEISVMDLSQAEKLKLWCERTGKSERAYWRALDRARNPRKSRRGT
jgi:hypothetical protein